MKSHIGCAALLAASAATLGAQTTVDLTRQGKVATGAQLPGQCTRGQLFVKTDGPSGPNLYVCTQDNLWNAPLTYVGGVGVTIASNSVGIEDAVVPLYSTGDGAPADGCVAGRDFYVDTTAGALYYCTSDGQWRKAVADADNEYTPGRRQSMTHDAANAGLRLVPAAGDPAAAVDGDLWYNQATGTFRRRQNGVVGNWDAAAAPHPLLGAMHGDTAVASVARGDLITGQGSAPSWTRLPLGAPGAFLRSNGADLTYSTLTAADLPAGYPWTGLSGAPASFTPSAHAAAHKHGGGDEVATATAAANAIPKAGAAGTLAAGWIPTLNQNTTGNAATATALASAPSLCAAGTFPVGVDAQGNAQGCSAAGSVTHTSGALAAGQLLLGNGAGDAKTGNLSGDCSTSGGTAVTCTKTNGVAFAASATVDATNAANLLSGVLPAGRLPNPSSAALGGVQSKDCTGTGHVLKINTDGTVGCSADGGGAGGVTLGAGLGYLCISEPCQTTTGGQTLTQNAVYYVQVVVPYTMTYKQFAAQFTGGAGARLVTALMDANCAKVAGTDTNASYSGATVYTTNNLTASAPTIAPGVYYQAWATDGSGASVQSNLNYKEFFYYGFYDGVNQGGTHPRVFTGSNAMTGSGATLAIPSSCGTKTNAAVGLVPVAYIVP